MEKLKLTQIVPDSNQPRKYFNAEKMHTLQESIKKHGIMQPLVVQNMGSDKYLLVDGERRYRAAQDLGLKEVPVIIEKVSSASERLIRQFNVQEQHEAWTPLEKAQAIIALSHELRLNLYDTCKVLGILSKDASRYIAFSELADKEAFLRGEMPLEFAIVLTSLKNEVVRVYKNVIKKEFDRQDEKRLEHRFILSVKKGEIKKRGDMVLLKDAFEKDPENIQKYLTDTKVTPMALFLASGAQGATALRNTLTSARYIQTYARKFLEQPDVEINTSDLETLVTAKLALERIIALVK